MWDDSERQKKNRKEKMKQQSMHSWEPRNRNHTWVPKMIRFGPIKSKHWVNGMRGFFGLKWTDK